MLSGVNLNFPRTITARVSGSQDTSSMPIIANVGVFTYNTNETSS